MVMMLNAGRIVGDLRGGNEDMTEKRFKVHTIWFNPEKTDGEHIIEDINGQPLIATKSLEDAEFMKDLLNELYKENEELKERNNRQYKQLNQVYHLIEAEDWETLTNMNNELKENEKQLQRESECY